MRIAFVGKGGSGKTTISSLFTRHLASIGKKVIALDADINQHLGEALSISESEIAATPSLSLVTSSIFEWVRGTNGTIPSQTHLRMTTPPGQGSRKITFDDNIIPRFKHVDGFDLVRTGDFGEEDVGMVCYHGKSSITEIVLNHFAEADNEYIVVDMTAGADAFSTGMFLKFDTICIVVEPTLKSVDVYKQYIKHKEGFVLNLIAVGNKITSKDDEEFLKDKIGDDLIGFINESRFIRSIEKGRSPELFELENENRKTLQKINDYLDAHKIPRVEMYGQLANLHKKHALSWLNDRFNFDFSSQIHTNFNPAEFYGE